MDCLLHAFSWFPLHISFSLVVAWRYEVSVPIFFFRISLCIFIAMLSRSANQSTTSAVDALTSSHPHITSSVVHIALHSLLSVIVVVTPFLHGHIYIACLCICTTLSRRASRSKPQIYIAALNLVIICHLGPSGPQS